MRRKLYSSATKLNSLPLGSKIFFGGEYSLPWVKSEKGWKRVGQSSPFFWDAKTVLAKNGNGKYRIETSDEIKGEHK